ncbi:hypothetical protein Tco_0812539 [Tanacetum coccineum]
MVDMINQRKKYFAEERAKAKKSKPMTQTQLRTYMSNYLKNQGTWKLSQLKKLTFEEIKEKFDKISSHHEKTGETTVPKEEEVEKSTKIKRRLKTKARKGLNVDKDAQEDSETDKEEDMEAIGAIPVTTKSPSVVNWKIFQQDITRDDLTELYMLVMQKYRANRPEDVYDRQKMLNWRYYDSCGVHCLTLEAAVIYMLTKRKYPLSSDACQAMLDMKLQGGKQNEECYQLLKLIEKQSKKTLP